MPCSTSRSWQRDSNETASEELGAVQSRHIQEVYEQTAEAADLILKNVLNVISAKLIVQFTNKRREAKDKILRTKDDAPSAENIIGEQLSFELSRGKTIFGHLQKALSDQGLNAAKLSTSPSTALDIPFLKNFAARAWPPNADAAT